MNITYEQADKLVQEAAALSERILSEWNTGTKHTYSNYASEEEWTRKNMQYQRVHTMAMRRWVRRTELREWLAE